jgi:hypothetical protein
MDKKIQQLHRDNFMKYLNILLLLIPLACNDRATITPTYDESRYVYTVKYGQTIDIRSLGLKVGFQDVLEDSRCPLGCYCYWEGVARLKITLQKKYQDTVYITVNIPGYVNKDRGYHANVDTVGYRITLLQLDPYPICDPAFHHQYSGYVALLEVSRI